MESNRIQQQQAFLNQALAEQTFTMTALPADASFRRYHRVLTATKSYLLMDAPPLQEDSHGFVALAASFAKHGVLTPKIYAEDLTIGLLLLEDFGDILLSQRLSAASATQLYHACFEPLLKIQAIKVIDNWSLPCFDQTLFLTELTNFTEWFLVKFLRVEQDVALQTCLAETFGLLQEEIRAHPQVCVHRDYHSRNLMILPEGEIGVLDFQDAVTGSITYDLVSLLRDCYVAWPNAQVQLWVADFYARLPAQSTFSLAQFQRGFDWQGMQRHLKCLFIFARKYLRDGSTNYLADLVTTFTYIESVVAAYPEFAKLAVYLPVWREMMVTRIKVACN